MRPCNMADLSISDEICDTDSSDEDSDVGDQDISFFASPSTCLCALLIVMMSDHHC